MKNYNEATKIVNVFNDYSRGLFSKGGHIRMFFKRLKYTIQRGKYGCSDRDTWDLSNFLIPMLINYLQEFENKCDGYPDCLEGIDSLEDWQEIISDIRTAFCNYLTGYENEYQKEYYEQLGKQDKSADPSEEFLELRNKYWDRENEIDQYKHNELKRGFDLLYKYFEEIWW